MRIFSTVLLLFSVVAACDSPIEPRETLPPDSPREHVQEFLLDGSRMELVTRVSDVHLRRGDSIAITLTLRNVSDRDVTLHHTAGCDLVYIVTAGGSEIVLDSSAALCGLAWSRPVKLPAGTELVETYFWNGTQWGWHWDGIAWIRVHEEPVRPGIYRLWGASRYATGCVLVEVRE